MFSCYSYGYVCIQFLCCYQKRLQWHKTLQTKRWFLFVRKFRTKNDLVPSRFKRDGIFYFSKMSSMKIFFLWISCIVSFTASSQSATFPQSWTGNWKGELLWYKTGKADPQKVNMELRIHPADSINSWSWQIIYGSEMEDNRPYKLICKDTSKVHWVIDENNGIVLDQYWVADKFCVHSL